jgi:acyl-CoA synthetase (AMP-forming)/AMP-acid ligase II
VAHFDAPPMLLPDLIDRQSQWRANDLAVCCDEVRLSWGEFGARVRRVAGALQQAGLTPEDRVVILMSNSLQMAEAIYGCLRAGLCVVPLNVSVSDNAVEAMIKDCGARAIIACDTHYARVASMELPDVMLQVRAGINAAHPPDTENSASGSWLSFDAWRDTAAEATPIAVHPEAMCNIIYSSGTTGVPKGIVHTHRRRADWAQSLALALRYHSRAVTLCSIGLYSNISWVSMLSTLVVGGCIVIEKRFEPARTLATIAQHRVTHSSLVPIMVQRLLEAPDFPSSDLSSLDALMCCGSPLGLHVKKRALQDFGCDFIELYGLTEGIITTLDPEDTHGRELSVGKPLPGTQICLLDDNDQPVPAGDSGEIVSRGHITMAGYHNRPEANTEASWQDANGHRWLRSGDIGRFDEEGFLYIVDRKKDMILSGGQNIYPADIENEIQTHPNVAEVAVIGVPSEVWGETPLAIVVARDSALAGPAAAQELKQWVNARLGRQQRISAVCFVDALPRNPNGKVLKRELRLQFKQLPAA